MKIIERFLKRKMVTEVLGIGYNPSPMQLYRLNLVFSVYGTPKNIEDWLKTIAYFVKYDLTNYIGRLRRLRRMKAAPDRYSLLLRYGKQESCIRATDYADRKTRHFPNRPMFWEQQGLGLEDAKDQARNVQIERNSRATHILRGSSEYTCRSLTYWMKRGLSIDEASREVFRVQSRNHTYERNVAWNEDDAILASRKYWMTRRSQSSIADKYFDMISSKIGDGCYYKALNHEMSFCKKQVDFYHKPTKTIIEFYGDYWHCNPAKYSRDFIIYGKSACHVILDDKRRLDRIRDHPDVNDIFIVWESEFRENPTEVVEATINILREWM
jgi:hypothetical protein